MFAGLEASHWGDGLPVVPATQGRVDEFIQASGLAGDHLIMDFPPIWGEATVEKIAVNAVMAGCKPEYMPVLICAIRAMAEAPFNLYGVQATTHPCAPLVLILGPIAAQLEINGGAGAMGPGWRSNATIGRAVRLCMLNLGGARPGILDKATMGSPAKYTYCITENESESPWEPYRITRGIEQSGVVVAPLEAPHNINDHASTSAEEILTTISGTIATAGTNCLYLGGGDGFLFLGPEHANQIAAGGFTRSDVQEFIFQHARTSIDRIGRGQMLYLRERQLICERYDELGLGDPDLKEIPTMTSPSDLSVLVVGGPGKHSMWAPPTGMNRSQVCSLPEY